MGNVIGIYRKILKIRPGTYIFQRPFLRGLFLEGLIFGGAHLWREICISKSIGLAFYLEVIWPLLLLLCIWGQFSKYKHPGGSEGPFNGGFFALLVWGLIFGGAYFQNFMVCKMLQMTLPIAFGFIMWQLLVSITLYFINWEYITFIFLCAGFWCSCKSTHCNKRIRHLWESGSRSWPWWVHSF